jgi:cytochrome c oxidase subunit 2
MSIIIAIIVLAGAGYFVLSPFNNQETSPSTGVVREFTMTAENFKYVPNVIEVNPGDTVLIHIKGLDDGSGNGHGFSLSNFKINEVIRKDKTTEIEFIADKKGTFTFSCSVPCGSGHSSMKGTLIVE